jgi:hypothetical protein
MLPLLCDWHTPGVWVSRLDLLSAVLGMSGTYFMAKRYANNFVFGVLFAVVATIMYFFGGRATVRSYYAARQAGNQDVGDSAGDVGLGLNLLFVAFLAQLFKMFVSVHWGAAS